jgi:hypothetical protein
VALGVSRWAAPVTTMELASPASFSSAALAMEGAANAQRATEDIRARRWGMTTFKGMNIYAATRYYNSLAFSSQKSIGSPTPFADGIIANYHKV